MTALIFKTMVLLTNGKASLGKKNGQTKSVAFQSTNRSWPLRSTSARHQSFLNRSTWTD